MRFEHTSEVLDEDTGNPTWRFVAEFDAEYVRERLFERGVDASPETVARAIGMTADCLRDEEIERVFDSVCDRLPEANYQPVQADHPDEVYDEGRFFLAIRHGVVPADPQDLYGSIATDDDETAKAVREHASDYPSISVSRKVFGKDEIPFDDTEGKGVCCEWRGHPSANALLSSVLSEQFEEEHGRSIDIPVLKSEFDGTLDKRELTMMRDIACGDATPATRHVVSPDVADVAMLRELGGLLSVILDASAGRQVRVMYHSES